jgi:hypothetical protein
VNTCGIAVLENLGVLLVIACAQLLVGLGVMRLLRVSTQAQGLLLAPTFCLAIFAVVLGTIVQLGFPVEALRLALWVLGGALAALGGISVGKDAWRKTGVTLAAASVCSVLLLSGYVWYGLTMYPGSPVLDGWTYASFGEYLRTYPKGTEGGLSPLYQYAAHLADTRFIASAGLALLAPPWCATCDTQAMVGPFLVCAIFAYATAVGYLAARAIGRKPYAITMIVIAVLAGWPLGALRANNFDNLLALSLTPALTGLILWGGPLHKAIAPCALLLAATIYIYPELAPLTALAYGCAVLNVAVTGANVRSALLAGVAATILAAFLAAPYLGEFGRYFLAQLSSMNWTSGARPGEGSFPALLEPKALIAALWGLPGSRSHLFVTQLVGAALLCGLAVGCYYAVRRRLFAPVMFLCVVVTLALYIIFVAHYDYGAYKVLLYGWWCTALVVTWGIETMTDVKLNIVRGLSLGVLVMAIGPLPATILWGAWIAEWYGSIPRTTMKPYRELYDLRSRFPHTQISAQIDDATNNAWAVYFLRGAPVRFVAYRGYMAQPHVVPFMNRSAQPSSVVSEYLLTERKAGAAGKLVWENELFSLWRSETSQ